VVEHYPMVMRALKTGGALPEAHLDGLGSQDADLVHLVLLARVHEPDVVAPPDGAVDHPEVNDHPLQQRMPTSIS